MATKKKTTVVETKTIEPEPEVQVKSGSRSAETTQDTSQEPKKGLDLRNNSLAREIASKQPMLVSGTNIKTINGQSLLGNGNLAVDRHFKGWWPDLATLKAAITAMPGDAAYVKDADPATTWSIFEYDATATTDNNWADSGIDADTSNVQTFASGEEVNEVHIVNDLTTGGADDVLSAEQGKELADLLLDFIKSLNILDPTTIIVGKYVVKDTGEEADIPSSLASKVYGCTPPIAIPSGGLVTNSACPASGALRSAIIYSDSTASTFVANVLKSSTTDINPSGQTNWNYVRFNLKALPEGKTAAETYAIYEGLTVPSGDPIAYFTPYFKRKAVTSDEIEDDAVTIGKIAEKQIEFLSDNICNPNDCYFGNDKYIDNTTGEIGTYTDDSIGGYTGYIPIGKNGVAVSNTRTFGAVIGGAVYYIDAQGNKVFKRTAPTGGIVQYDGGDSSLPDSNPLHYPDAYVRYTLRVGASASNVTANIGLSRKAYVEYEGYKEVISEDILPNNKITIENTLANNKIYTDSLELVLPPKFYCVKGDTLQLFYKGLGKVVGLDNRYVKPTCDIGTPYKRYLEIPSTLNPSAGSKSLSIKIYDDNMNVLAEGTSSIQVVNTPSSPSSEKHILCIGSSTMANGKLICEAQRRLLASDGIPTGNGLSNIKFVGSQSKTLYGQTAKFYAKSGWGWKDFVTNSQHAFRFYLSGTDNPVVQGNTYTNNGYTYTVIEVNTIDNVETILCSTSSASNTPQASGTLTPTSGASYPSLEYTSAEADTANLFWDSGNDTLNFTNYVDTYCEGSVDMVVTQLGVNKIFDGVSVQEGYVRTFIESLHDEYPSCKIVLATDAYPSMELMMPGYGASGDLFSNSYKVKVWMADVHAMYKRLAEEYSTRAEDPIDVTFELWTAQVDSDYNFPITEKNVNTRNSSFQEPYANNTIHPGEKGYLQEGDALYRSIVANLCQ